jgi:hypothetical protein
MTEGCSAKTPEKQVNLISAPMMMYVNKCKHCETEFVVWALIRDTEDRLFGSPETDFWVQIAPYCYLCGKEI